MKSPTSNVRNYLTNFRRCKENILKNENEFTLFFIETTVFKNGGYMLKFFLLVICFCVMTTSKGFADLLRTPCEYIIDWVNDERYLYIDGHVYLINGSVSHMENCPCRWKDDRYFD